jgi:HSP20 family protein
MADLMRRRTPREISRRWRDPFDSLFTDWFGQLGLPDWWQGERTFVPAVDVTEDEENVLVRAEMPGMNKDDIEVTVRDNTLLLRGEKKTETNYEKENVHRYERRYGRFERVIALPEYVDSEKVAAKYEDGILTLTLPKTEASKPKQIKIS